MTHFKIQNQPAQRAEILAAALRQRQGQATLEMTVGLILIMLLVVGSVRIFLWLNERMVYRQADYESSRVSAGADAPGVINIYNQEQTKGIEVDESSYPQLNIFG